MPEPELEAVIAHLAELERYDLILLLRNGRLVKSAGYSFPDIPQVCLDAIRAMENDDAHDLEEAFRASHLLLAKVAPTRGNLGQPEPPVTTIGVAHAYLLSSVVKDTFAGFSPAIAKNDATYRRHVRKVAEAHAALGLPLPHVLSENLSSWSTIMNSRPFGGTPAATVLRPHIRALAKAAYFSTTPAPPPKTSVETVDSLLQAAFRDLAARDDEHSWGGVANSCRNALKYLVRELVPGELIDDNGKPLRTEKGVPIGPDDVKPRLEWYVSTKAPGPENAEFRSCVKKLVTAAIDLSNKSTHAGTRQRGQAAYSATRAVVEIIRSL